MAGAGAGSAAAQAEAARNGIMTTELDNIVKSGFNFNF